MLADNAVVVQFAVTVSATVLLTVHCSVVFWPSRMTVGPLIDGGPCNVPIEFIANTDRDLIFLINYSLHSAVAISTKKII